jgi:hypothetical protein
MPLRKNLYSQKFKDKPIKPSYVLDSKSRLAAIKIIEKYTEYWEDEYGSNTNSIKQLYTDFLENYRLEKLPNVTLQSGKVREATILEYLKYDWLSTKTAFLDAIQIFIDYAKDKNAYIEELNTLFELDNFGYRIINNEIAKIGSSETFENIITPALKAVESISFENAKSELQEALHFYYQDKKELAIKKALDSVDSLLKYIVIHDSHIRDKDITDKKGNTKSLLERVCSVGYFKNPVDVSIGLAVEHILCPLRNKIPGAGHSKGIKKVTLDDELVELSINIAATYITFLIKRFKDRNP